MDYNEESYKTIERLHDQCKIDLGKSENMWTTTMHGKLRPNWVFNDYYGRWMNLDFFRELKIEEDVNHFDKSKFYKVIGISFNEDQHCLSDFKEEQQAIEWVNKIMRE